MPVCLSSPAARSVLLLSVLLASSCACVCFPCRAGPSHRAAVCAAVQCSAVSRCAARLLRCVRGVVTVWYLPVRCSVALDQRCRARHVWGVAHAQRASGPTRARQLAARQALAYWPPEFDDAAAAATRHNSEQACTRERMRCTAFQSLDCSIAIAGERRRSGMVESELCAGLKCLADCSQSHGALTPPWPRRPVSPPPPLCALLSLCARAHRCHAPDSPAGQRDGRVHSAAWRSLQRCPLAPLPRTGSLAYHRSGGTRPRAHQRSSGSSTSATGFRVSVARTPAPCTLAGLESVCALRHLPADGAPAVLPCVCVHACQMNPRGALASCPALRRPPTLSWTC